MQCSILGAQESFQYDGVITTDDLILTYYIEFELNNNNLEGYSITEKNKENETKNKIKGFYRKKEKVFEIQEETLLETKSSEDIANFCYLELILNKRNKNLLDGTFVGRFLSDSICATGNVTLIQKKKLEKIKKRVQKKIITEEEVALEVNDTILINTPNKDIIINLWDSKKIDGDAISLLINNHPVLEEYIVSDLKKTIPITLEKGINYIQILATSIGKKKPNTIGIELITESTVFPFTTKLDLQESSIIRVNLE